MIYESLRGLYPLLVAGCICLGEALAFLHVKHTQTTTHSNHTPKPNLSFNVVCTHNHNSSYLHIHTCKTLSLPMTLPTFLTEPFCPLLLPTSTLTLNLLRIPATMPTPTVNPPRGSLSRRATLQHWSPRHTMPLDTRSPLLWREMLQLHRLYGSAPNFQLVLNGDFSPDSIHGEHENFRNV